jgi:hypothetical protein
MGRGGSISLLVGIDAKQQIGGTPPQDGSEERYQTDGSQPTLRQQSPENYGESDDDADGKVCTTNVFGHVHLCSLVWIIPIEDGRMPSGVQSVAWTHGEIGDNVTRLQPNGEVETE